MYMQKGKATKRALSALAAIVTLAATSAAPASAQAVVNNTKAVLAGAAYDGFIVKFRDGTPEKADNRSLNNALANVNAQVRASGLLPADANGRASAFALQHKRRLALGSDVIQPSARLTPAQAVEVMRRLAQLPGVEYVEPDMIMWPHLVPNDPLYSQQWGLNSTTAGIRTPGAWDKANGAGVTIAVIDSGIAAHNDLQPNLLPGYDFISDPQRARDNNGRDANPEDNGDWQTQNQCPNAPQARPSSWHGTHVAGIAAAAGNNGNGVTGVAYGAKILPVRVAGLCGAASSDISDAVIWASGGDVSGVPLLPAANHAKVINLSLGGPGACPGNMQSAINAAVARGATVVVSAGNSASDAGAFQSANCQNVVVAASVDSNGGRSSYSNHGGVVDVAAPGSSIQSTFNSGSTTVSTQSYGYLSGTSMSAPHVAGTVALMQSRRLALGKPLLSPGDAEQLLKDTAYGFPASCTGCGRGIIDANAAVTAAATGSIKLSEHTDASGRIQIAIFMRNAPSAQQHFTNFSVEVPDDYVVVGGGGEGRANPIGHMLTASYPNAALSAWLVSSKDHHVADPVAIRGWAIGLKIAGLTRQQVRDAISVTSALSAHAPHPKTHAFVPDGYWMLGGGFQVNWFGAGSLGVSSYPITAVAWGAQSKEHHTSSGATVRAFAIGIRKQIPGVGNLRTLTSTALSPVAAHPDGNVALPAGYALTGCGAQGRPTNTASGTPENLLWRIQPVDNVTHRVCFGNSKDHVYSFPGSIYVYALGLQVF